MRSPALLALAATLVLAACGGGGGGSTTPPTGGGGSGSTSSNLSVNESAISSATSLSDPLKTIADYNTTTSGSFAISRSTMRPMAATQGTCIVVGSGSTAVSYEFFSPDKNGDANSTEDQYFYDSACSQLQRDVVRIFNTSGTSETVNRTVKDYAQGNATPINTRTDNVDFINGTYDQYGYPVVADGFARSAQGQLNISGAKTIVGDNELVMTAGSGGSNTYCGDGAGYNATGIASLNETFGWQGQTASGTRTVNNDGSVTWNATHAGFVAKGAIGSLSVGIGSQNTACPIATPQFTLSGGTQTGTYNIPVTVTYMHNVLVGLTVTNATLANGNTLNVTTNTSVAPTASNFISGTISNSSGTQIATYTVNNAGNGTLTVTATGAQYVMNDWYVIK